MTTIRDTRVKRGISQKELARAAGIDARTLRKIENGVHVSDLSQHAVEQALGVSAPVPASGSSKSARSGFRYYGKLGLIVVTVLVMTLGLCWGIHKPNQFWPLYGILSSMCMFFATSIYWLANAPLPGNTNIEIMANLTAAAGFGHPRQMAEGWLGRSDLVVKRIVSDQSGLRFTICADFDVQEYPRLVQKLRGFGLDATVSTAF
jgi:transcriptional regulator with XRE-family HTH domain